MAEAPRRIEDAFAPIVRDTLRPLSVGFGLFIAYNAITGALELSGRDRLFIVGADVIVAVYLLSLAAILYFRPPPLRWMNALGASMALMLTATDTITTVVKGAIPAFPALVIILAGYGALVLNWKWLLSVMAAIWATWLVATWGLPDLGGDAVFILQIGTILGIALHWGRVRAYSALIRSQWRAADAQHDLLEINQELDRFASTVAHDLKNPLTAFSLKARTIGLASSEDSIKQAARQLEGISKDMNELIESLLAYARAGELKPEAEAATLASVATHVKELFQDAIAEAGGTLAVAEMPDYAADRTMLTQLLQNLVGNAIMHRSDDPPRILVGGAMTADEVSFFVRDNGVGLDPDKAAQLFKPFERGDDAPNGHGLGLATCARIVERMDGRIDVDSKPGVGSTFTVVIPMQRKVEGKGEKVTVKG